MYMYQSLLVAISLEEGIYEVIMQSKKAFLLTGQAELKITAGHWPFSVHILPNGQPFPKVVGTDDYATIPLNALLTS